MMREGWTYKKLGEVATLLNGFAFQSALFQKAGLPIVRISNIQEDKITSEFVYFNKDDYETDLGKFKVLYGDILIAMSGATTGKVGINYNKEVLYLNQRVGKIVPKENMAHRFLFYYLKTNSTKSLSIAQGVAQPNLSTHQINNFVLPVPPLSEQERIVSELDLLSGIIEKKKAQLKEYDKLAQSIFYDMFGDPVTNEKGWEVKKLEEVCNGIGDGLHGTPQYDSMGNIAFINGNNLIDGKITITEKTLFVNEAEAQKIFIKLDTNTILLSINGTLGKTAIYRNENIVLGKSACYIKLSNSLNVHFVMALINTNAFKNYLEDNSSKSTIKNVGLKAIRNYGIILPPLPLQQSFASKIEAIERQKALIQQSITETETLFNSRMDYYFD